jgi:hypothetical protein
MHHITQGVDLAKDSLLEWRHRYPPQEYPYKVMFNLFYRAYPYEWFWDNRDRFFSGQDLGNQKKDGGPQAVFDRVAHLYRQIQMEQVFPNMEHWINSRRDVGVISHDALTPVLSGAQQGRNQDLEQLEFTFCYDNAIFKCLNVYFAAGWLGLNQLNAFFEATGASVSQVHLFSSLNGLMASIQNVISFSVNDHYAPLPDYF